MLDLYDSQQHSNNFAHFAALVYIAQVDGVINKKELVILKNMAKKLDISEKTYRRLIDKPEQFPIVAPTTSDRRLERIFNMFKIIFSDHIITNRERELVYIYAKALGFSKTNIKKVIDRSEALFSGNFSLSDYIYFVKR